MTRRFPARASIWKWNVSLQTELAWIIRRGFHCRLGRKFIVGDSLTLADIDVAGPFSQIDRSRPPLRDYPNIMAWHDNLLRTVPAWAETKDEVDNRMDSFLASVGVKL